MENTPASAYRHRIEIVPGDIDRMGHVNNAVYLTWIQQAAIGYWKRMASAEEIRRHMWVALKHDIEYKRPAFLYDAVEAIVISEGTHGARAFFKTFIKRGEEVLAEVHSSWCCINADTKRPARIGLGQPE